MELVSAIVQNVILLLALTFTYGHLIIRLESFSKQTRSIAVGILFAVTGLLSVEISNDVFLDGHTVITLTSGMFGGPIAAFITGSVITAYHVFLDRQDLAIIVIAAAMGIWFHQRHSGKICHAKHREFLYIGLSLVGISVVWSILVGEGTLGINTLGTLIIFPLVVLITSISLSHEFSQYNSEKAHRESEKRYRSLVENSPAPISVHKNDVFVYLNPTAMRLYGFKTEAEYKDKPICEYVHPDDWEMVQARIQQSEDREYSLRQYELRILDVNKHPIDIEVTAIPIIYMGEPAHQAIALDITARKQAEANRIEQEKLKVELEKERELSDLRSQFIAMVSHEFRTPLATVQSSMDMLQRYEDRMDPQQKQTRFDNIQTQIQHMTALLEDVLTIGKAQNKSMKATFVRIRLNYFCQSIIEEITTGDTIHHQIHCIKPEQEITLVSDEKMLRKIIANLVSNAIKYSPPDVPIELALQEEEDHVIVTVKDHGVGIPEKDLEHVFTPFHRATNVRDKQGTGLGLAVVRSSVRSLGGTIDVKSEVNVGTTFTINLPKRIVDVVLASSEIEKFL